MATVEQVQLMRFFKEDMNLRRINFRLKNYAINGGDGNTGYVRLDRLIHDNAIRVNRRFSDAGFGDATGAASYVMATDTFSLSTRFNPTTGFGKAILAHEGAHALIDMQKLGSIDRGTSEAIAYTAEAIWLQLNGYDHIKDKGGVPNPVRVKAFDIADTLISARSSLVPDNDAEALVNLIIKNKQYDDPSPHISDGIG